MFLLSRIIILINNYVLMGEAPMKTLLRHEDETDVILKTNPLAYSIAAQTFRPMLCLQEK